MIFCVISLCIFLSAAPLWGVRDSGAESRRMLIHAVYAGEYGVVRFLLDKKHVLVEAMPLFIAAQQGDLPMVMIFLAHGADPNKARETDGATPLFIATQQGKVDVVETLLAHHADPCRARADGATPLHMAAYSGNLELVRLLVAAGASLATSLAGTCVTPEMLAHTQGHSVVAAFLREAVAAERKQPIAPALYNLRHAVGAAARFGS